MNQLADNFTTETEQRILAALTRAGLCITAKSASRSPQYGSYSNVTLTSENPNDPANPYTLDMGDMQIKPMTIMNRIVRFSQYDEVDDTKKGHNISLIRKAASSNFLKYADVVRESLGINEKISLTHAETFDQSFTIIHTAMRKGIDSNASSSIWSLLGRFYDFDPVGCEHFHKTFKELHEKLRGKTMSMYTFTAQIRKSLVTAAEIAWHFQDEHDYDRHHDSAFSKSFADVSLYRKLTYLAMKELDFDDWCGIATYYQYCMPKDHPVDENAKVLADD